MDGNNTNNQSNHFIERGENLIFRISDRGLLLYVSILLYGRSQVFVLIGW